MAIAAEARNYEYYVRSAVDDWPLMSPAATVYGNDSTCFDAIESLSSEALFEPVSTTAADLFNATSSFGACVIPDANFAFVGDAELDSFFEKCLPNIKHESNDKSLNEDTICFDDMEKATKDLPENPSLWTADDCVRWLEMTCSQFQLSIRAPTAYRRRVAAGGCALLNMSADEFCACLGDQTGSLLFTQLRLWNAAFESTLSNPKDGHLNGYFGVDSSYCEPTTSAGCQLSASDKRYEFWTQSGSSLNLKSSIKKVELSSNSSCISAENEGFLNTADDESFDDVNDEVYGLICGSSQPQHNRDEIFMGDGLALYTQSQQQSQLQPQFGCGEIHQTQLFSHLNESGYPNYYVKKPTDELCDQTALRRHPTGRRLPAGVPPTAPSGTIHLWHFIRELLDHPLEYGSCVRWVNRNEGTFKIESSQNLAQIWGQRKNRSAMNYDKLSRSLRQYYKKGIIQKPEKKQRLVYRFLPPYHL